MPAATASGSFVNAPDGSYGGFTSGDLPAVIELVSDTEDLLVSRIETQVDDNGAVIKLQPSVWPWALGPTVNPGTWVGPTPGTPTAYVNQGQWNVLGGSGVDGALLGGTLLDVVSPGAMQTTTFDPPLVLPAGQRLSVVKKIGQSTAFSASFFLDEGNFLFSIAATLPALTASMVVGVNNITQAALREWWTAWRIDRKLGERHAIRTYEAFEERVFTNTITLLLEGTHKLMYTGNPVYAPDGLYIVRGPGFRRYTWAAALLIAQRTVTPYIVRVPTADDLHLHKQHMIDLDIY